MIIYLVACQMWIWPGPVRDVIWYWWDVCFLWHVEESTISLLMGCSGVDSQLLNNIAMWLVPAFSCNNLQSPIATPLCSTNLLTIVPCPCSASKTELATPHSITTNTHTRKHHCYHSHALAPLPCLAVRSGFRRNKTPASSYASVFEAIVCQGEHMTCVCVPAGSYLMHIPIHNICIYI